MRFLKVLFVLFFVCLTLSYARQDYDDEEFEGEAERAASPAESKKDFDASEFDGIPEEKEEFKPLQRQRVGFSDLIDSLKVEDFYPEIGILVLFALYGINFWIGKGKNFDIATAWLSATIEHFQNNFSYLGDGKGHLLIKDSQSDYIFYASGRVHCKKLLARIELRKRHDLASVVQDMVLPTYDKILIEVEMNDKDQDNFVFGIVKKKLATAAKKERYDLTTFSKTIENHKLSNNFVIFSEFQELLETVLRKPILDKIEENMEYIDSIFISDQPLIKPTDIKQKAPKTICFVFRIPDLKDMQKAQSLQELVTTIIDNVPVLSKEARSKSDKSRIAAEETLLKLTHAERQEAAQNRKAQKLESMTPEQRREWEEKNQQKQLKKRSKVLRV